MENSLNYRQLILANDKQLDIPFHIHTFASIWLQKFESVFMIAVSSAISNKTNLLEIALTRNILHEQSRQIYCYQ